MKKGMVVMIMVTMTAGAFAQGDAIAKFFAKYQSDDTFSQVTVSSKMFSLFTNMELEDADDQEVLDAISKLKGLKILAKESARNARELYNEANAMIPMKEYEELMYVRDKDKDMKFFIKEGSGKITELVMVAGGNDDFMLLTIFGEIDLKQISRMGKKMDVKGLENLERIKDRKRKN